MSTQYSISVDDEFLRVKVWGRTSDQAPSEVCAAVLSQSRTLGRSRILIELDQAAALSPASQFKLVTALPQAGLTSEQRMALVHRVPQLREDNEFINLVARNRGIAVRNFRDMDGALEWLRGEAIVGA